MTRLLRIAVLLTLTVGVAATPVAAADQTYVALGDSYSSGVGAGSYRHDGAPCRRSRYAYPVRVATLLGVRLDQQACSGARIRDVSRRQLGALSASTAYVTISVGGNDAGFSDVLTECAQPGWMSSCDRSIDTARAVIRDTLPRALATLYARIRSRAPRARVLVVGYPRLFGDQDCDAGTWFSARDRARLNHTADLLDKRLAEAAAEAGFAFADPTARFARHAVCDRHAWLHGLSRPLWESFHPNRSGHADGYVPLVSGLLRHGRDR